MGDLAKNFSRAEFACKCGCGFDDISQATVDKLQTLRNQLQQEHLFHRMKIKITSGCRCPEHNAAVGGWTSSQHMEGTAADIQCFYRNEEGDWKLIAPSKVADMCEPLFENGGLGRYFTFTHVDTRGRKARWPTKKV